MAQDLPAMVELKDHSWRFKKSKATQIQSIPKTVWLLDKPSEEAEIGTDGEFEDYPRTNDMVLLKGEFDLVSNHKEENIRRELEGIFSRKFPGLTMHDFEFVKRDRNRSSIKPGTWNIPEHPGTSWNIE